MNIRQYFSFQKIKWCGAAKHGTHGTSKKRLTLQHGCPKKLPDRPSGRQLSSKTCVITEFRVENLVTDAGQNGCGLRENKP
jgi:hypothetical protein